jgi:drug/metabolite transporter (DMT)-like permease
MDNKAISASTAPSTDGTVAVGGIPRLVKHGMLFAVLGSITFSGKAIIVKLGYGYGADAITLLMWRMLFALPLFLVMAWWAGRGRSALTPRDWLRVLGLGFTGFYLASYLDFAGLRYITASLERLILCVQPTLVLLFGWLFLKRRVLRGHILGIAVSYAGVLVVFGQEALAGQNRSAALGTLLVFLSTVSYAIYLLWSGDVVKRLGSVRLVGLATSVACVLCIVHYLVLRSPQDALAVAPQVIWLSLLNAILCTVVPVWAAMMAVERIGAASAAQIGTMGPIFVIMLGVAILGEPFTAWVAAGAVLVIAGILLFTRADRFKPAQSDAKKTPEPQEGLAQRASLPR